MQPNRPDQGPAGAGRLRQGGVENLDINPLKMPAAVTAAGLPRARPSRRPPRARRLHVLLALIVLPLIPPGAPAELKSFENLPHKDDQALLRIRLLREVVADTPPVNRHGPFMPFSRVTFERHGVPFDLRFGPQAVEMVYDRAAVSRALAAVEGPRADFARAELALADARYEDAARRLQNCLATVSSEDLDFRAAVNQQLRQVHRRLSQSAIRSVQPDAELENCLGMTRTAGTIADEIESLFALSEVYERRGDHADAARTLKSIIDTCGRHEYPVAPVAVLNPAAAAACSSPTRATPAS